MKELIAALQDCVNTALLEGHITPVAAQLVHEHIASMQKLAVREEAIQLLKNLMSMSSNMVTIDPDSAPGALAKVCLMLVPYGSKPDAIHAVIQDRGWTDVTIDDVHAVRTFLLENV